MIRRNLGTAALLAAGTPQPMHAHVARMERIALDDPPDNPRPSLEERYGMHDNYVAKVKAAAASLVQQRFLLQDDVDRLIREAEAGGVLR